MITLQHYRHFYKYIIIYYVNFNWKHLGITGIMKTLYWTMELEPKDYEVYSKQRLSKAKQTNVFNQNVV